jgi:ribosomal-protein-serine acetyltransferase
VSPVFLPEHMERGGLRLRLWEPGDEPAMAACIGDNLQRLARFMPWVGEEPLPAGRRRGLIRRWREQFEAGLDATYGIWLDGAVAGGCGLHQRIGPGGLEIGYWVDHRVARRRVAATTSALLTQAALDADGVDRVEIRHAIENTASGGVPRLLRYRCVGEEDSEPMVPGLSGVQVIWRLTVRDLDHAAKERLGRIVVRQPDRVPR